MTGFLHKIWVVLFAFMIFGLMALAPVEKYQKSYMQTYRHIRKKTQKHLDANYKYADFVEDGGDVKVANKLFKKWANEREAGGDENAKRINKNKSGVRKPYFVRDKYNPNILHPYRD